MNDRPSLRRPSWPGLALAAAGSIALSGKAIIVKLAYRHCVDTVTLIMYRMLFALPMFLLLAWWAGRGKPALTRRDGVAVAGLGFSGSYLASFLDFAGLQFISAGLERLILSIWLGRLVASLLPDEGEALGLLSMMLHAHARREARRSAGTRERRAEGAHPHGPPHCFFGWSSTARTGSA